MVVKSVLMYGLETLVMYLHIGRTLGSFHHSVVHKLTGRYPRRRIYGKWVYPPLVEEMAEAGMKEV